MATPLVKRLLQVFTRKEAQLSPVSDRGGWRRLIREPFSGAWQRNLEVNQDEVLSNFAVFSCMTLIAGDISKMRMRLMENFGDYWSETEASAFSPILRKPNSFQTRQQYIEHWILSKLSHGNAYAIKQRDERNVVIAQYVLDPSRVMPLITPSGSVYYRLKKDELSKVMQEDVVVPASEIFHDRMNTLFHPLMGLSPLFACSLSAIQGLRIQKNSEEFFGNYSQPGGVLTAPEEISDDNAARLKEYFEENFTGTNAGRVAVLGDGLKYQAMTVNADDAQLIEQLKWSAEAICAVFHVPPYMIGVGQIPSYQNVEALNQQYFTQCLQTLIEAFEASQGEGLKLPIQYRVDLDLDGLLRMDTLTRYKAHGEAMRSGWIKPDEIRAKEDMPPVEGGNTPYLQQQNYSLAALAKRDLMAPAPDSTLPNASAPQLEAPDEDADDDEQVRQFLELVTKGLPELTLD